MNIPTTAAQFRKAISQSSARWVDFKTRADKDDSQAQKTVFRLTRDHKGHAHVEYAYGRLIVCFDRMGYYFDLDRLHEHYPEWSWQRQIGSKTWCLPEHLELVNTLCELFPVPAERIAAIAIRAARRRSEVQP